MLPRGFCDAWNRRPKQQHLLQGVSAIQYIDKIERGTARSRKLHYKMASNSCKVLGRGWNDTPMKLLNCSTLLGHMLEVRQILFFALLLKVET